MLFGKPCPNCDRQFVFTSKPHKDLTAICPGCQTEVSLADAKPLPEEQPATATKATKEATK